MNFKAYTKNLGIDQNVSFRVLDKITGEIVQEHIGHNTATNSMLIGIGNYLTGNGILNQGYDMLSQNIPRYISLGTMGLYNQEQDSNFLPVGITGRQDTLSTNEATRFIHYMEQVPGFGADGWDPNENNDRTPNSDFTYMGLGPIFDNRGINPNLPVVGQTLEDDYIRCPRKLICTDAQAEAVNCPYKDICTVHSSTNAPPPQLTNVYDTVKCELISKTFPRSEISFRQVLAETESELPKTIDVVFSAMISTGALAQFRPPGKDYIYITEAGLWSKKDWRANADNGLLAGYRIIPPNEENWDMSVQSNRDILKKQILRVGRNQVVQVIWKIQLGAINDLYPIIK